MLHIASAINKMSSVSGVKQYGSLLSKSPVLPNMPLRIQVDGQLGQVCGSAITIMIVHLH